MTPSGGYIRIYRQMLKWEWWDDPYIPKIFLYILLSANYTDSQWHGMTIKRGQLVTSLGKISRDCGLGIQIVRTALSKLESTHELTRTSTSKYTILTVNNYDLYQSDQHDSQQSTNIQLTNNQQSTNIQLTTSNKYKNINNIQEGEEGEYSSASGAISGAYDPRYPDGDWRRE